MTKFIFGMFTGALIMTGWFGEIKPRMQDVRGPIPAGENHITQGGKVGDSESEAVLRQIADGLKTNIIPTIDWNKQQKVYSHLDQDELDAIAKACGH